MTQADLAKQVGVEHAALTMAYLHVNPEAIIQKRALSFDVARQKLANGLFHGHVRQATVARVSIA